VAECRGQSAPFENTVGDSDIAAESCFAVHDLLNPIIAGAASRVQALILADSPSASLRRPWRANHEQ
jgi:hypothetical protein